MTAPITEEGLATLLAVRAAAEALLLRRPSAPFEPCGTHRHPPWQALVTALVEDRVNPARIAHLTADDIDAIIKGGSNPIAHKETNDGSSSGEPGTRDAPPG